MAGGESTFDALDVARFWAKIEIKRKRTSCWLWRDAKPGQYPSLKWRRRTIEAHRVAYEIVHGPIPPGMIVRHDCDNPACCNPLHLRTGTHADNVRDRVLRRRSARGEHNGRAKLTERQVREILTRQRTPEWYAMRFRVTPDCIYAILEGRSWRHLLHEPNPLSSASSPPAAGP